MTKTIFCDIDGTLFKHPGSIHKISTQICPEILPNILNSIELWDKLGYKIILTTGRRESQRKKTELELNKLGVIYDQLIMGIGNGDRILINDKKPNGIKNTCYALNVVRNKGITNYNFENKNVVISDEQPSEVEKPWGKEELLEYNDKYVVKRLFMKANESCSLQYHEIKRETIYVLSGKLKLYIGTQIDNLEEKILISGDTITIHPYSIHRMEGIEDSHYLECSTVELWDVIRLQDKYNRKEIDDSYVV